MAADVSPALARAFEHAQHEQRRVVLPRPEVVRKGIARRPAAVVPFSPRPVAILAPHAETPTEVHEFVLQQFPPAAQRLAR